MARIPEAEIERLKSEVSVERLIESSGIALKKADEARWTRMSVLNTASSGFFSPDRTMQEYNSDIWKLK